MDILVKIKNERGIGQYYTILHNSRRFSHEFRILSNDKERVNNPIIQQNFYVIDISQLINILSDQFCNIEAMEAISCFIQNIQLWESSLSSNYRLREYFGDLEQFGPLSNHGVVMDGSKPFIIKASRNTIEADEELIHETFIGLKGTNQLRKFIPNFVYVFGFFECSCPVVDTINRQILTWCNNKQVESSYIVYEKIFPNRPFRKLCRHGTVSQILNAYLQVAYSLILAYKVIDFTHYDLHLDNVLIRILPDKPNISIPYETENGKEYLNSNFVATIIDYGSSHIQFEGRHYGRYGIEQYGVLPDSSFVFHDMFKLLMFILEEMKLSERDDYIIFQPIVDYILGDYTYTSFDDLIYKYREYYYALPNIEIKISPFDLTHCIRTMFPVETSFFSSEPEITSPNLNRGSGKSSSSESDDKSFVPVDLTEKCDFNETLSKLNLSGIPRVKSVIHYFDLMTGKNLSDKIKKRIRSRFRYREILIQCEEEYSGLLNKFNDLYMQTQLFSLKKYPLKNIYSDRIFKYYRHYVERLAEMLNVYTDVYVYYRSLHFTYSDYDIDDMVSGLTENYIQQRPILRKLVDCLRSLKDDIRHMHNLITANHDYIKVRVKENPMYNWYEDAYPMYLPMSKTKIHFL